MLTVAVLVSVVAPAVHRSVYVVCCVIGLEARLPERPVHASSMLGLFSVTVHDDTFWLVHWTCEVAPRLTKEGETRMVAEGEPEVVGEPAGIQMPAEQV